MYKVTEFFGWLNLLAAAIGLVAAPFVTLPQPLRPGALVFILVLMAIVAAAIVFTSKQKAAGTDIGEKAYTATLAAYVLWAVMAFNWFG